MVYAEITLVLKTWSKAKLALSTLIKSYGSLFGVSHLVVETWKISRTMPILSLLQVFRVSIENLSVAWCIADVLEHWVCSSLPLGRQRQIWTADYWFHSILLHLKLVTEERFQFERAAILLSQNWVKLNYGNVTFVFVGKPQYFKSLRVEMSELLPSRFLEISLIISGNAYSTTLTRKTRN